MSSSESVAPEAHVRCRARYGTPTRFCRPDRYVSDRIGGRRVRILVVEDDRPLADAIARGLRRDAFAVDVVHDGAAALDKSRLVAYDAIVLDRDLPVVHGDEVCRRLSGDQALSRILMLT